MSVVVREMTAADIAGARALWAATEGVEVAEGDNPGEMVRFLQRNPGLSSVAVDDGQLVAALMCGHDGRRGFLYHLAVASGQRGHGLGRKVIRRSLGLLRGEGITRALLFVAADNSRGREFWLHEGWEDMPNAKPMGVDL